MKLKLKRNNFCNFLHLPPASNVATWNYASVTLTFRNADIYKFISKLIFTPLKIGNEAACFEPLHTMMRMFRLCLVQNC